MTDRDADAEKLAGAMGWTWMPPDAFGVPHGERGSLEPFTIPAPDAPLGEKLAFVGKLAEALGPDSLRFIRMIPIPTVCFHPGGGRVPRPESAPDLVHAAIRAALATRS